MIPKITEKRVKEIEEKITEFMPLSEAADLSGYTPEYLNLLSRKGKLKSVKIGRNWYTKKQWLDQFLGKEEKAEGGDVLAATSSAQPGGFSSSDEKNKAKVSEGQFAEISKIDESRKNDSAVAVVSVPAKSEEKISLGSPNSWMKIFASLSSAVIILPLVFATTYALKNYIHAQKQNSGFMKTIFSDVTEAKIVNENTPSGIVAGEETANSGRSIVLASENFKVSDINIGGDILIIANGDEKDLEIGNIKSESFISGKGDEVKLVVAWQTNKMASSELSYSKNDGQTPEIVKEESFGFSHSAVIPGLDQGSSYVYQIKCKDRWANEKTSEFFGIYTSSKPISVFELIANALGEVFGWAIKK